MNSRVTEKTILRIACQYCRKEYGLRDGQGVSGTSHGICATCWTEHNPNNSYPVSLQTLQECVDLVLERREAAELSYIIGKAEGPMIPESVERLI